MLLVPATLPESLRAEVLEDQCRCGERERLLRHGAVGDEVCVVTEQACHGRRVPAPDAVEHQPDRLLNLE